METVICTSGDIEIRLVFNIQNRLKYTYLGKGWPKHTQCLMYVNNFLMCSETIVKHERDIDNKAFACRRVAESCMKKISNKWLRAQVRIKLNEELAKL